jgi:hypothetical protein
MTSYNGATSLGLNDQTGRPTTGPRYTSFGGGLSPFLNGQGNRATTGPRYTSYAQTTAPTYENGYSDGLNTGNSAGLTSGYGNGYSDGIAAAAPDTPFAGSIKYNESVAALRRIPVYIQDAYGNPIPAEAITGAEIQVSKSGSPFVNGGGTVQSTPGSGGYYYEATAAETQTYSFLMIKVVPGGFAKPYFFSVDIGARIVLNEPAATRRRIPVFLEDLSGNPVTGLSITGTDRKISKNGTLFATGLGAVTEIGSGAYYYELAASEVNTPGFGMINIVKSPAVPFVYTWDVLSPSSVAIYRMRAYDSTLAMVVFWKSSVVDALGGDYLGPGPLINVVVQNVLGKTSVSHTGEGIDAMPEQWGQQNVAASQTNVPLECLVSTNFDTIKMMRAGSIVGLSTRLTEAVTFGTLTVTVTKNGAAGIISVVHISGSGGVTTQGVGIDTYAANDLIGIRITTSSGFLPTTTDLEAWLEFVETV